jgi:MFS family permease
VTTLRTAPPAVALVFGAKTSRTFCYGFLGIVFPLYLGTLGVSSAGIGMSITCTLAGSAVLTWAVRRPAERLGARAALLGLAGLSVVAGTILLVTRDPRLVVLAAMLGNVAVGTGETGPFLTVEQVVIARAIEARHRTLALSVYNVLGYAAGAVGAAAAGFWSSYRLLFAVFLAGAVFQCAAYAGLPPGRPVVPSSTAGRHATSTPLIHRLAVLFAIDSFGGGFVLQSLVVYFLYSRFGLTLPELGGVFFAAQILTAASLLLAARAASRFGLLPTMVVSHFVSNVFLVAITVAPTATAAIALLLARQLLSQMDVPTRQAYVMAVVADHEREAAASLTNLSRTVAQAVTPALTGWIMQTVALSAPFAVGGGLKMVYDVLLWLTFRDVKLREEA